MWRGGIQPRTAHAAHSPLFPGACHNPQRPQRHRPSPGTNVFVSGSRETGRPPFLAGPSHTVLQHLIDAWREEGSGVGRASPSLDAIVHSGMGADPEDIGLVPAFRSGACRGAKTLPDGGSCRKLNDNEIAVRLVTLVVEKAGVMVAASAGDPAPESQES